MRDARQATERTNVAPPLRVAVIGAGAVGLGIGSCLLNAGAHVLFIAHSEESVAALRTRGLSRSGLFGEVEFAPSEFDADTRYATLLSWHPDHVLVCTKTTACEAVAGELARTCGQRWSEVESPPGLVLCLNGWGNLEHFAAKFPPQQIHSARVITGFRRDSLAHVEITAHAEAIHIGNVSGHGTAAVEALCQKIAEGGIPCAPSSTIERDLLAKLLYNCALNPLAALLRVPYGALGEHQESRALVEAVVHEIFEVLDRVGLETHWSQAVDYLGFFWSTLLPPTRQHESSMLQDLRAGRSTEIDALCGAVVALGRDTDIDTPVNAALSTLVRAIESIPRA